NTRFTRDWSSDVCSSDLHRWFDQRMTADGPLLVEALSITDPGGGGQLLYNGEPKENRKFYQVGAMSKIYVDGQQVEQTGPLGPFEFLATLQKSEIIRFLQASFEDDGKQVTVYYSEPTLGEVFMLPGLKYKIGKDANVWSKLDFISLMLAL